MIYQTEFSFATSGRGLYEISEKVEQIIPHKASGLVQLFLQHTSASLIITENADPTVLEDLETIITRLAPDGDSAYQHDYEGPDDMAAHVRAVLTCNDLSIPVVEGKLALGAWQGVFLWEHRYRAHMRNMIVTVLGR
ncbi:MAG: secondary thiamine-phosphate synthase enzyme [Pseudoalteromonas tetraodonis]|jgi:secondary thiamine-phosphate synthase enzyme